MLFTKVFQLFLVFLSYGFRAGAERPVHREDRHSASKTLLDGETFLDDHRLGLEGPAALERDEYQRRFSGATDTEHGPTASLIELLHADSPEDHGWVSSIANQFKAWCREPLGHVARALGQVEYPPSRQCDTRHLKPFRQASVHQVASISDLHQHLFEDGPIIVKTGIQHQTGIDDIFANVGSNRVHFDNFHSQVYQLLETYGLDGFLEDVAIQQHNMTLQDLLKLTNEGMTVKEYAAYVKSVSAAESVDAGKIDSNLKRRNAERSQRLESWLPNMRNMLQRLELDLTDPFPHFFAKLEDVFARPLYSHDFPTLGLNVDLLQEMKRSIASMKLFDFISGEGSSCVDILPNSEVKCAPNLFWGGPRTHAYPLHRNVHENDILKFQVKGRTRVAMFHPREAERLYPLRISQWKFQVYMSDAFSQWPCDEYPQFSSVTGFVDILDEGDILMFSGRWIHDFENLDEAISIIVANVTDGFVPYKVDKFTASSRNVVTSIIVEGNGLSLQANMFLAVLALFTALLTARQLQLQVVAPILRRSNWKFLHCFRRW